MKRKFNLIGAAFASIALISSCSSSDDCHECHLAYMNAAGNEVEVEIGEYCGSGLEEVEDPNYTHTLDADVIVGNDTVPAGDYTGMVHCEEHGDDHDH